jgi:YegS/Rv2252/BmrU family lipid kinase
MDQNNKMQSQWLVVVNPNAGNEKGFKDWETIEYLLEKHTIDFQKRFTEARFHAIHIVIEAVQRGFRKFIAVGGDGTMNEVLNGCFLQQYCSTQDITLAMITVGTGNDWGRMFGIPVDYEGAIRIIKEGKCMLQDTGVVHHYHGVKREKRFFINIAGLGFDAIVVKRTNRQKDQGKSGKMLYFWNLLRSLLGYRHVKAEIVIDGKRILHDVFSISLGIGRFSGGGMMQTPMAVANDGLFDITVIKRIRKGEVIRSLKMLYDGTILNHPKIESFKGKDIQIDAHPLIHVETDGESLGHSPIEFTILPRSIRIIHNLDEMKDHQEEQEPEEISSKLVMRN